MIKDEKEIIKWATHMPHKFPPVVEESDYVDPEGLVETFTRSMTKAEICFYLTVCDVDTYTMYKHLWQSHLQVREEEQRLLSYKKRLVTANINLVKQKVKI